MAVIKLGLAGAQVTLPAIVWPQGSPPTVGVEVSKSVDLVKMLDGSNRANVRTNSPSTWPLVWDGIEAADVTTLLGVVALNGTLVYTNEYGDGLDYNVVITSYGWALKAETAARTSKFTFSINLAEVG